MAACMTCTEHGSWLVALSDPRADPREPDGLASADLMTQTAFARGYAHWWVFSPLLRVLSFLRYQDCSVAQIDRYLKLETARLQVALRTSGMKDGRRQSGP
jgi:hypothetical protein